MNPGPAADRKTGTVKVKTMPGACEALTVQIVQFASSDDTEEGKELSAKFWVLWISPS